MTAGELIVQLQAVAPDTPVYHFTGNEVYGLLTEISVEGEAWDTDSFEPGERPAGEWILL